MTNLDMSLEEFATFINGNVKTWKFWASKIIEHNGWMKRDFKSGIVCEDRYGSSVYFNDILGKFSVYESMEY